MIADGIGIEPDFAECAKIKPEFAGVLVDWSIGAREITATIADLALRGALFIQGDRVWVDEKGGRGALSKFESEFICTIFQGSKSLAFDEMRKSAYEKNYGGLLKLVCRGMIDEGIIRADFQKVLAYWGKKALSTMGFSEEKMKIPPNTGKPIILPQKLFDYGAYLGIFFGIMLAIQLIIGFVFTKALFDFINTFPLPFWRGWGGLFILLLIYGTLPITAMGFFITTIFIVAFFLKNGVYRYVKKLTGRSWQDLILTEKGRKCKDASLNLQQYMKRNPLAEDRIGNELGAHAIAFGFGTKWLKKLGGKSAQLSLIVESVAQSPDDTVMSLIDMDSYLKEFS